MFGATLSSSPNTSSNTHNNGSSLFFPTRTTTTNTNLTLTTMKRKRNQDYDDPFTSTLKISNLRSFIRKFPIPFEVNDLLKSSNLACRFLRSGDLMIISNDKLTVFKDFYEKMKEIELSPPLVYSFPSLPSVMELKFVDSFVEYFPRTKICKRKELFLITENGLIILIDLMSDILEPLIQRIHLSDATASFSSAEKLISFQIVSDQHILLLSSHNEIYLIERQILGGASGGSGRYKMTADKLTRPYNALLGFLQTGVKSLFGFGAAPSSPSARVKYSQVFAVSAMSLAFTVGSALTIWENFQSPGNERVFFEHETFAELIKSDIRRHSPQQREVKISFLQVEGVGPAAGNSGREAGGVSSDQPTLAQREDGRTSVILLLLTASSELKHEADESFEASTSLWLHVVEFLVPPTAPTAAAGTAESVELKLLHRSLISSEAVMHVSPSRCLNMNPKLFAMPLAWRVFLSWVSFSSKTLQTLQLDVFNQVALAHSTDSSERGPGFSDFRNLSSDTAVEETQVLTLNDVDFVDGIVSVVADTEEVMVMAPRLPMMATTASAGSFGRPSTLAAPQAAQPQSFDRDKILSLLLKISYKKTAIEADIGQLRNLFIGSPLDLIADCVQHTSRRIVNRSPVGQLWGSTSSSNANNSLAASQTAGLTLPSHLNDSNALLSVDKTINEYQLVHRLLHDKVQHHNNLLLAVIEADASRYEQIIVDLLANHQRLLFCNAFSDAIQEIVGEIPLHRETTSAVGYLTEAVAHHIQTSLQISLQEIRAKGLSLFDQFYAQTEKIYESLQAVMAYLTEHFKKHFRVDQELVQVLFVYLQLFSLALAKCGRGDGGDDFKASAAANPVLRETLLQFAGFFLSSLESIHKTSPQLEARVLDSFSEEREGRRLSELFRAVLQGYEAESHVLHADQRFPNQHMPKGWQAEYARTKEVYVKILLALRHHHLAFHLAQEHGHFHGLFLAVEAEPSHYQRRLEEMVETEGNKIDTNPQPLALAYFHYLHDQGRFSEILSIGRRAPAALLQTFLRDHPHLAFIQAVQDKDYLAATSNAHRHAQASLLPTAPPKAKTFLSFAKLCGKVATAKAEGSAETQDKPPVPTVKPLPFLSPAASAPAARPVAQPLTAEDREVQAQIQKELTLLRIAEDVQTYLPITLQFSAPPSSSAAPGSPAPPSRGQEIVEQVVAFLRDYRRHQAEQEQRARDLIATGNRKKTSGKVAEADEEVLYPPVEAAVWTKVLGELLAIFELERSAKESPGWQLLCLVLWKEIVLLNEMDWLNFSMVSLMNQELERQLTSENIFYALLLTLHREQTMMQSSFCWFSPLDNRALMDQLIEESGLLGREMNQDGDVCQLPPPQRNERVGKLLLTCLDLVRRDSQS